MAAITFNAGDGGARDAAPTAGTSAALTPTFQRILRALVGDGAISTTPDIDDAHLCRPPDDDTLSVEPPPCFGSLEPDILSQSIPAFFIGRNADGFWVAREREGRIGGIFLLRHSALSFAHRHAGKACATIVPACTFELDIQNSGNRLLGTVAPLMRSMLTERRRVALKNFGLGALTVLLSSSALAAIIALRTAVYLSRMNLGVG